MLPELNKYLVHHGLSSQVKKSEKPEKNDVACHILVSEARGLSDDDEDMDVGGLESRQKRAAEKMTLFWHS